MPHEEYKMRTLPIDHAQLVGLRFCGSGKRSQATIEFAHARKAIFSLSYATMELLGYYRSNSTEDAYDDILKDGDEARSSHRPNRMV